MSDPPLRVCFVSLLAYPYFTRGLGVPSGGAELQMYHMAAALAEQGDFDVSFIVSDYGQERYEEKEGVKLYRIAKAPTKLHFARGVIRVGRLWRLLEETAAEIYIHRAWASITGEVALYTRLRGRKFAYMVGHDEDLTVGGRPSYLPPGLKGKLHWKLFSLGLRLSDLVVVQHAGQQSACRERLGKECVVRPSAHRRWPAPTEEAGREHVLWTARCERWKGPERFLDLAARFPDLKFVMICPPAADRAYFEAVRGKAREQANVRFIEFVPFEEMAAYFRSALLFVNTSVSEGYPNTFVQACQGGAPIVSFRVDPGGILGAEGIGRTAEGNFERLCGHVGELVADESLREKISRRAVDYFGESHDLARVTLHDREMILRLAGREGLPGEGSGG